MIMMIIKMINLNITRNFDIKNDHSRCYNISIIIKSLVSLFYFLPFLRYSCLIEYFPVELIKVIMTF